MISSRQVLSTKLGIDNILASNKKKKPVLEAVVQYLMKRKEKLSSPTQKVEAINANPQTLATDRSDSILDKDVKNISSELKLTDRLKPLKRRTSLQNSWSNEPVSTVAHKEPIVAKFDELVIQDAMDEDFIIQPKNSLITQPSTPLKNNNVVAKNISQQVKSTSRTKIIIIIGSVRY